MCNIIAFLCHCQTSANIAFDMAEPYFHQFSADAAKCWIFLIKACQSDSEHHIAGRLISQERCKGKSSNISLEFTGVPKLLPAIKRVARAPFFCDSSLCKI